MARTMNSDSALHTSASLREPAGATDCGMDSGCPAGRTAAGRLCTACSRLAGAVDWM